MKIDVAIFIQVDEKGLKVIRCSILELSPEGKIAAVMFRESLKKMGAITEIIDSVDPPG